MSRREIRLHGFPLRLAELSVDAPDDPLDVGALLDVLGPGLITGASDDDPSGIATYSQAGAQGGFGLLWTVVLTWPMMVAVQSVSRRRSVSVARAIQRAT